MKIVAGMSGGVDSAIAAALLKKQGHTVVGLFLDTGHQSPIDARDVCSELGIEFARESIASRLDEYVITPFVEEYLRGRTPNPCVICNPEVKFAALLSYADSIGFDGVATGHYARTQKLDSYTALLRAKSPNDQSYMLYRLGERILSRLFLPLGEMQSKEDVRKLAFELGLKAAGKPDSMEICFIPDNNYAAFIERRAAAPPPGDILDISGNVLGRHRGIHHHTIGQRRHLGVASAGRLYVTAIDAESNRVVLGGTEQLIVSTLSFENAHWIAPDLDGKVFSVTAKLRHGKTEHSARLSPKGSCAAAQFGSPVKRPAPGQSVVFYDGDFVLGGGICL